MMTVSPGAGSKVVSFALRLLGIQHSRTERVALAGLRDGNVAAAVDWYARAGRLHPVPDRHRAVAAMVKAWAADTAAGNETLMLGYRRDNVEALNQTARRLYHEAGLLSGPELTAPDGRRYRAEDRIIALAPGPHGACPSLPLVDPPYTLTPRSFAKSPITAGQGV
jgi:hypothetical protein